VGLILDSSVLIAGERRRETVKQVIERVNVKHFQQIPGLTIVTL
jgi:hypothetical protein